MMEKVAYFFSFLLLAGSDVGFPAVPLMGESKKEVGMEGIERKFLDGRDSLEKGSFGGVVFPENLMSLSLAEFLKEYEIRVRALKKSKVALRGDRELEKQYLLYELGFKCPERARIVMEGSEFPYKEEWRTCLMQGWAQADFQGAMDYFIAHKKEIANGLGVFKGMCVEMVRLDPQTAENWGLSQSGDVRSVALKIILKALGENDASRIPEFVKRFSHDDLENPDIGREIVNQWGVYDWEAALNLSKSWSKEAKDFLLYNLARELGRLDMEKAALMMRRCAQTPEEAFQIAGNIVSANTSGHNPRPKKDVLEWVIKHMSDHPKVRQLASMTAQGDMPPNYVFKRFVSNLPDGPVKEGASEGLRYRPLTCGPEGKEPEPVEWKRSVHGRSESISAPKKYEARGTAVSSVADKMALRIFRMSTDEMLRELRKEKEREDSMSFNSSSDNWKRVLLCRRLGQAVPLQVLEEVLEWDVMKKEKYINEIMTGWQSANAEEAFCYCWSYSGDYSFAYEKASFLSQFPLSVAIKLLGEDRSKDSRETLYLYLERMAQETPDRIPEFIQRMGGDLSEVIQAEGLYLKQRIAEYWARTNPRETLLWIASFPQEEQSRMIIGAMKGMPWDVLDRNLGILDKETRTKVLSEIFSSLLVRDAVSALRCLEKNMEESNAISLVKDYLMIDSIRKYIQNYRFVDYVRKMKEGKLKYSILDGMKMNRNNMSFEEEGMLDVWMQ